MTRSTIVSLLVTLLFWFAIFGIHAAEEITLGGKIAYKIDLELLEENLAEAVEMGDPIEVTDPLQEEVDSARESYETWASFNTWFYAAKTVLPKTTETIDLLDRTLRTKAGLDIVPPEPEEGRRRRGRRSGNIFGTNSRISQREIEQRQQELVDSRSVSWIIGSSLIFEAFLLAFCCWRFSRRDF